MIERINALVIATSIEHLSHLSIEHLFFVLYLVDTALHVESLFVLAIMLAV